MAKYTISNINGDSKIAKRPAGYTSWIDFWEKKTGRVASRCMCTSCDDIATDGAHVNVEGYGRYWYITPLCHAHNMSPFTLEVEGPLVPINSEMPILW